MPPFSSAASDSFFLASIGDVVSAVLWAEGPQAEALPEDLAAALKDGVIGSAALNWATSAPLPKDSPLWSAPNLILAPWAGTGAGALTGTGTGTGPARSKTNRNGSDATREARWLVVREDMRRFATGDKMYSVFDLKRGY